MKHFVLDASVALSWFIDQPTDPYAERVRRLLLQGSSALVPAIWPLEIANGFLTAERRGLSSPSETAEMLAELDVILRSIEVNHEFISIRRVVESARHAHLTAYDTTYLDLARERRLSIAALDRRLLEAAQLAGVSLVR